MAREAVGEVDPLFLAFQLALAGRYSIDREIGRGGMGIVYLAREVHLDRPVAIKLLPPERAKQRVLRERFMREARLAAKLSHPNIIPIHAVDESGEFVFYVMAYVDGETLTERVRTRGPVPATDGARILREVAWALAYAHGQGLIHRDVKPDNILLENGTNRVLVADFGIAAAGDDLADGVHGTPEFMSPEQALGTKLDARSDIYGMGATAFYAFSGRFPFEGKTATEVLAKQVTAPAPQLTTLGLTVPRKLSALIDRCLAKSPDHRPESAQAVAEQLGVTLEHRRELPAPMRTFVKRAARLDGPGTLMGAGVLAVASAVGSALLFAGLTLPGSVLLGTAITLTVVAPFIALADAASGLVKRGYSHRDIGPAFDAVIEQNREEIAASVNSTSVKTERVFGGLAAVSFGAAALRAVMLGSPDLTYYFVEFFGRRAVLFFDAVAIVGGFVGVLSGMMWIAMRESKKAPEGTFWAKLWKGRIGQAAFALASKYAKGARISALTHRATELSLGMAAEQLFESLDKETRKQLGDIPTLVKRLQDDAQVLRQRHDAIKEALADAGDAAAGAEYAEVRAIRDELHAKLGDAVGALETIRLNLLRLHAGALSVESVTTHLDLAEEVSIEVERLIAAHGEIDRALRFPRPRVSTPV